MCAAAVRRHQNGLRGALQRARADRVDLRPAAAPHRRTPLIADADVIIINWNSREETLACLDAVFSQQRDCEGSVTVTVVDNGSTDGSIAAITSRYPSARFLPLGTNRGFTGGIAAAIATSKSRYVIFLNNDAIPEPHWLNTLLTAMEAAPADVLAIGGKIIDLEGKLIDFIGGILTFDGHALQRGFRMPLGSQPEPSPGAEILFACGGNMIARREPFLELGGFDDDYFAYLEDVDFGWRTWLSGWRILAEPRAVVRHASAGTSQRLGDFERGVLFERNALQTAIKNYEKEELAAAAGGIFYTYLARLHHYATSRNRQAEELSRPGLGSPAVNRPSFAERIRRRLFGRNAVAQLDDPLTVMQFRAFDWFVRNEERVMQKRTAVQALRRRPDKEIFEKFPLHIVPTYPGDDALMNQGLFALLLPRLPLEKKTLSEIIRT
ncbi:MAG TPA: glycosyltransferase family 2 protein [Thermoanaerobaculia bacterium]|nr:glycosyltransferase family 2 protein [Thermoanaerobaculia bacterium]